MKAVKAATWSNCLAWADQHEATLWAEWERAGRPHDRVPAVMLRPSRSTPNQVRHWVVGWWFPATSVLQEIYSYVPLVRRDVPKWLIWTRLLFRGRVKAGDAISIPPKE